MGGRAGGGARGGKAAGGASAGASRGDNGFVSQLIGKSFTESLGKTITLSRKTESDGSITTKSFGIYKTSKGYEISQTSTVAGETVSFSKTTVKSAASAQVAYDNILTQFPRARILSVFGKK